MDTAASSDVPAVKRSKSGGGRAFYSRLEPFVEFIREQRRRRRTWKEIAEALRAEKGCAITFQGVHQFYRRYVMRQRYHHLERQSETGPVAGISEESPAGSPPMPVPSNYPLSSHQSLWACPVCRLRVLWMEITDPRNERALEAWSLAARSATGRGHRLGAAGLNRVSATQGETALAIHSRRAGLPNGLCRRAPCALFANSAKIPLRLLRRVTGG